MTPINRWALQRLKKPVPIAVPYDLKRWLRVKPVNSRTISDKALTSIAKILSTKEKPC